MRSLGRKAHLLPALALALQGVAVAAEPPPPCRGPSVAGTSPPNIGARGPQLVRDANFPDPFVARFGRTYYAYGTAAQVGQARMNVQLIRSRNLADWSQPTDAMPSANLPAWVDPAYAEVWAPEVMKIGRRYVMYFNARHATETRNEVDPPRVLKRHCLGAAVSARPEGPFVGLPQPLVCKAFLDGVIDPSPFRDGPRLYLYYKLDGNCCGHDSALYVQRLRADGLAVEGAPRRLLANNDSPGPEDEWEWKVVEAPTMVKRGGSYFLFYSGNFYGNKNYSVAYLRCTGPMGPCVDVGENPIVWSHPSSPLIGPGHQSVLQARGRTYLFFHGWNRDPNANEVAGFHKRCLYVGAVEWTHGSDGALHPSVPGGKPETTR